MINSGLNKLLENKRRFDFVKESKAKNTTSTLLNPSQNNGNGTQGEDNPQVDVPIPETTPGVVFSPLEKLTRPEFLQPKPIKLTDTIAEPTSTKVAQQEIYQPPDERLVKAVEEEGAKSYDIFGKPTGMTKSQQSGLAQLEELAKERRKPLFQKAVESVYNALESSRKTIQRGIEQGNVADIGLGTVSAGLQTIMTPMNFFTPAGQKMGVEFGDLIGNESLGKHVGEFLPFLTMPNPIAFYAASKGSEVATNEVMKVINNADMSDANKERILSAVGLGSFILTHRLISGGIKKIKEPDVKAWLNSEIEKISSEELNKSTLGKEDIDQAVLNELNPKQEQGLTTTQQSRIELKPEEDLTGEKLNVGDVGIEKLTDVPKEEILSSENLPQDLPTAIMQGKTQEYLDALERIKKLKETKDASTIESTEQVSERKVRTRVGKEAPLRPTDEGITTKEKISTAETGGKITLDEGEIFNPTTEQIRSMDKIKQALVVSKEGSYILNKDKAEKLQPKTKTEKPQLELPEKGKEKFLLNKWEDSEIETWDIINELDGVTKNKKIQSAINKFRKDYDTDRLEYGSRSGLTQEAEDNFMKVLREETSQPKAGEGEVKTGGKVKPIDDLIKKYEATGRVAYHYPKKKQISLNGITYPEAEGIKRIKETLQRETPPASPVKTGGEVTSLSYLEGETPDFSNLQSAKNNKTGRIAAIRFTNPEGKIEIAVGSNHGIGGEEIVKKYGQEFYDKIFESGKFESGFVALKDNKFEVTRESKPIISEIKQLEPVRTDLEKLYGKKLEELPEGEINSLLNALNSDVTTDFRNIFPISDNQAKIIRDKFSQAKNVDNNKSEAMRLFKLKRSDREVGLALNVKPSDVRKWREEFEKTEPVKEVKQRSTVPPSKAKEVKTSEPSIEDKKPTYKEYIKQKLTENQQKELANAKDNVFGMLSTEEDITTTKILERLVEKNHDLGDILTGRQVREWMDEWNKSKSEFYKLPENIMDNEGIKNAKSLNKELIPYLNAKEINQLNESFKKGNATEYAELQSRFNYKLEYKLQEEARKIIDKAEVAQNKSTLTQKQYKTDLLREITNAIADAPSNKDIGKLKNIKPIKIEIPDDGIVVIAKPTKESLTEIRDIIEKSKLTENRTEIGKIREYTPTATNAEKPIRGDVESVKIDKSEWFNVDRKLLIKGTPPKSYKPAEKPPPESGKWKLLIDEYDKADNKAELIGYVTSDADTGFNAVTKSKIPHKEARAVFKTEDGNYIIIPQDNLNLIEKYHDTKDYRYDEKKQAIVFKDKGKTVAVSMAIRIDRDGEIFATPKELKEAYPDAVLLDETLKNVMTATDITKEKLAKGFDNILEVPLAEEVGKMSLRRFEELNGFYFEGDKSKNYYKGTAEEFYNAVKEAEKPKEEIKSENRVVKEETYQQTRKNLKGKLGNLSAGIDPTTLKDLATIGAYHFENGLRKFSDWSKKMIEEFGEKIVPHLRAIWDETKIEILAQTSITKNEGLLKNPMWLLQEAVNNTKGAKITERGLELEIERFQKPEQAGEESVRSSVFYLPELNQPQKRHYSTGKQGYGGKENIQGRTIVKNPIIVKAGTGGRAPQLAYDEIKGKGAYEKMRTDVLQNAWEGSFNRKPSYGNVEGLLEKYGGDPYLTDQIIEYSKEGNTLPYAIQENIVANVLREAGYDAILGVTKRKGTLVFSELMDLREDRYPTKEGDFGLRDDLVNRFVSEETYKQAKQNIISKGQQLTAGIDPTLLKDYAIVGSYHLENIARKGIQKGKEYAEWTKEMLKELGEEIKPYLKQIWDEINKGKTTEEISEAVKETKKTSGEIKVRGLAKSTEADAIASGIVDKINNLPTYEVRPNDPQIKIASDIIANDLDRAKRIEFGIEKPPDNMLPGFIHTGLKDYAVEHNDVELMMKLATSPYLSEQGTIAGQFIQALGKHEPFDPVDAIKEVIKGDSPANKRIKIIRDGLEQQIKLLENKIKQRDEEIKKISAERTIKKIKREVDYQARRERRTYTKEQLREHRSKLYADLYKETANLNLAVPLSTKAIKILGEITKDYVIEGLTDVNGIIDAIHMEVKDKIEGITKQDIRNAISGYGRSTERTKTELQKTVQDLKQQMETISKLEDLESGKLPIKRPATRTSPSEQLKSLKAELKQKLKESGVAEEEKLSKAKEKIQKSIKEYEEKISKGEYSEIERTTAPIDKEKTKLQEKLKETREKYKDIQQVNLEKTITLEEATKINELSKIAIKAKDKMDNSTRSESLADATDTELEYGRAKVAFVRYIDHLKASANKLTWKEFKASPLGNIAKGLKHLPGMTKSLKATFDNSGLFNQNITVLFTHPNIWQKNARKSFQDIWNVMGGKNVMDEIDAWLVSRPKYEDMLIDKLAIGTIEEAFPDSKLLEKIPYLGRVHKATNTAFTGLAYRNRADIYDLVTEHAKNLGYETTTGLGIGSLVNSLTGRGSLGRFERGADVFNTLMFAPRFLKSHIDVLVTPFRFGSEKYSPFARKEAAKNLMKIVGGMAAITVVANAIKPGTVETDPRSTDFMKIKVGDTRFNFTGGLGAIATLAARLIPLLVRMEGYTKNEKGELVKLNSQKFGARTGWDVLVDFMRGKSSPASSFVIQRLMGQTFGGDRLTLGRELSNIAVPLPLTNYNELMNNPKSADIIIASIADALGIFTNTYSDDPDVKKIKKDLLRADEEKLGEEATANFYTAVNNAKDNGLITQEQYDDYKRQFEELQSTAPIAPEEEGAVQGPRSGRPEGRR